jgi:hypothetical protein
MTPLTNHAKDSYIAPELSNFTEAAIPDMGSHAGQVSHWLDNHVLNVMLRGSWEPPLSTYVFNFLRRATNSFRTHGAARQATLDSLARSNQSPSLYCEALFHWEAYLGQSWHTFKLLEKAFSLELFRKGSASELQRLNALYNQMKHVESQIECAQIPAGATVPVWLTNDGLKSTDAVLSFVETGRILEVVASWADVLVDPKSAPSKIKQAGGDLSRLLAAPDRPHEK